MSGLAQLSATWSPEKTETVTGIASEVLRELVRTYLNADGAALYSSTGVNMGANGALSFWIQE